MNKAETDALKARCTRFLCGHGAKTGRAWLDILAAAPETDLALDVYSDGPAIDQLEAETAALLGKPAALFFHKGVVAQQAALLVHATPARGRAVALHPRSHLAQDETDALDRLAGLYPVRTGAPERPFTTADLDKLAQPLAAVTVEIPLRRSGFLATPWNELVAIAAWARDRGVPFHLDGARIWEVAPYYGKTLAEIAALADTVYVSFYKGLGGMGGCVLAGPADFIAAARPWRNRFGGDLPTIFPYVVTALAGLRRHLPQMPVYHRQAISFAQGLAALPGLRLLTQLPHGNSFLVRFDVSASALRDAHAAYAAETGIWLYNSVLPGAYDDECSVEIVVGAASLAWSPAELVTSVTAVLTRARSLPTEAA